MSGFIYIYVKPEIILLLCLCVLVPVLPVRLILRKSLEAMITRGWVIFIELVNIFWEKQLMLVGITTNDKPQIPLFSTKKQLVSKCAKNLHCCHVFQTNRDIVLS